MDLGLKGKVALITGANNPQGIGAATAFRFAEEGVKIVLAFKKINFPYDDSKTGRNGFDRYHRAVGGGTDEVEASLKALGADYLIVETDITDERSVADFFEAAEKRFGRVEILVNNAAGYGQGDTILEISPETIDAAFEVNVKGTLMMIREFVKRRGDYGRIINLSTDAAQVFAGQIAYGSSKAAVEALTRSIALEVGAYGITVNTVAPGPTQTGWIDEELEKSVLPLIPLGRLGRPEDIAETIVFLASERASWLTGNVIKVSGGHAL